jgi:EAL domain-containing protein (putative c-di-GMP-specific phosphodiesterase class I)
MPPAPSAAISARDRFVGFAFAAADLLVEMGADRLVRFAAGAFPERFGTESSAFEGRNVAALITAEDQGGLEIALSVLASRGRLTPVALRLANTERTPVALSGLRLPNHEGMAWLTLARMPAPPADSHALAATPLLRDAMAARLNAAEPCGVGLVEVGGWAGLPEAARPGLESDIAVALRDAGGNGSLAAQVSEGKFGVLGGGAIDMPELQRRIGGILKAAGAGRPVAGTSVPLALGDVGASESMRVMRFALNRFAAGGTAAVREEGLDRGLRHFLDRTEAQAAATRSAIQHGRFRMVFQPVVSLADRVVHHYEALLRPFPVAGQQAATTQEFVSFAEAIGLAETLDGAVLQRTVETIAAAKVPVAINVSGLSMQSAAFRDMLLGLIDGNAAFRRQLMVELTETADIDDVPAAVDTVNRLSAAGVPMCLDDFGAGFAAFRYLKEFKVDYVKIDGSYVRNARSGARESGFVGAMVELARCVGARAIAEMVETEAQAASMMALGVQFGQGWLFGKPGGLPGSL